jgi:hypothetical protein
MKEVILRIDDAAVEQFLDFIKLCPSVEVVSMSETAVVMLGKMSERVRDAIIQLREERLLRRKFDYAWLKDAMNALDDMPSFDSAQKFLDYLRDDLKLDDLPCESSISKMMVTHKGEIFNWTFFDTNDEYETTRRNNIVKRFFNLMRGWQ